MQPNVLSIAGSDPSGGAGVQADLKTFNALGVYGMAVITALTAQNTQGVSGVYDVSAGFVKDQLKAVFDDIRVDAVKIGMLARADIVEVVADVLDYYQPEHIVLDPVMVATSGDALIDQSALEVMKERLFPLSSIITPNIPEAEKILRKVVMNQEQSAQALLEQGSRAVLLKGGHLKGEIIYDALSFAGGLKVFELPRVDTENTHGTGCTLSAAIAVYLAKGEGMEQACWNAKQYVHQCLLRADDLSVGQSNGPLCHG